MSVLVLLAVGDSGAAGSVPFDARVTAGLSCDVLDFVCDLAMVDVSVDRDRWDNRYAKHCARDIRADVVKQIGPSLGWAIRHLCGVRTKAEHARARWFHR